MTEMRKTFMNKSEAQKVETMDDLIEKDPEYQSQKGHLAAIRRNLRSFIGKDEEFQYEGTNPQTNLFDQTK